MSYEYDDDQDDAGASVRDGAFRGRLDQETFQALLFNSFLHQQEQARERRFEFDRLAALVATHRELVERRPELRQAWNLVAGRALEITGATGAAIALAGQGRMVCRAIGGVTRPPLGTYLSPDSGLSAECVRSGRTLRCDDTENDPRVDLQACRSLGGVRSLLLVPLRHQGNTFGVFELFSTEPYAFASSDEHVLELLGVLITATMSELAGGVGLLAGVENGHGGVVKAVETIAATLETILREHQASPSANL